MKAKDNRYWLLLLVSTSLVMLIGPLFWGVESSVSQPANNGPLDQLRLPHTTVESEPHASTVGEEFKELPLPDWIARLPLDVGDIRMRPILYWRAWSNRALPVIPSVGFVLLMSLVPWALIPKVMAETQACLRGKFWKSVFSGMFSLALSLTLIRCLVISDVGIPLAVLILSFLQLGLLLGISASSLLVGRTVLLRLHLTKSGWLSERPNLLLVSEIALGAGLIALLLQIPGIGVLPRIGTRLVMLLAILGLGSLVRAWFVDKQNVPS